MADYANLFDYDPEKSPYFFLTFSKIVKTKLIRVGRVLSVVSKDFVSKI